MEQTDQTLTLEHLFNAPIHVVFDYFTVPNLIKTWWGPQSVTTEVVEINLQVGGRCRWEMRDTEQKLLILHGQVIEVDPPSHLVMTHQWEGNDNQTTVSLEFIPQGGQTKLILRQTGILSDIPIRLYDDWWSSTLSHLDYCFNDIRIRKNRRW